MIELVMNMKLVEEIQLKEMRINFDEIVEVGMNLELQCYLKSILKVKFVQGSFLEGVDHY